MWSSDFSRLEFVWNVWFHRAQRVNGVLFRNTSIPPLSHAGGVFDGGRRSFAIATWWGTLSVSEWPTADWMYLNQL